MTKHDTGTHAKPISFAGLTPLNAPVPPMLEKAIDYHGEARFVSFHWTPYGDEADYNDGQRGGTGNWQGFLAFVQHPTVYPLLSEYNFGSSEDDAQHALILDRQARKLYIASIKDTDTFLGQQWPKTEPIRLTREEWERFKAEAIKNIKQKQENINMEDIHRRMEEQYAIVEDLQHWLNKFLPN
jgi:hypothetical protein